MNHAGKNGIPVCGTKGKGDRFNVVVLGPKDWNQTKPENRCSKCIAKLKRETK